MPDHHTDELFSRLPRTAPFATAIVDTRCHEDLLSALRNVAYFLPNWSMYVLHSTENEHFLAEALGPAHRVNLRRIADGNFTSLDYNGLLASPTFWEMIDAEKILIFQPDAFLRRSGIAEFMEYDYIGAPWAEPFRAPSGAPLRIGNGGLSLRSRSTSLAIAKRHQWMRQHEDLFFAEHLLADRASHLPDVAAASRFAVETLYYSDPMGLHNTMRYLSEDRCTELYKLVVEKKPYELTIIEASYGSESKRLDVSGKMRSLVQEDRLWIPQAANIDRIFSDPAVGVIKTLSVAWKKTWRNGARIEERKTVVDAFDHHLLREDLDI